MSKVKYTVDVDEYICSALDQIRKMNDSRDYSSLLATVERIQHHASMMEQAISSSFEGKYSIRKMLKDKELSDADFKKKVSELKAFKETEESEWEYYG